MMKQQAVPKEHQQQELELELMLLRTLADTLLDTSLTRYNLELGLVALALARALKNSTDIADISRFERLDALVKRLGFLSLIN